MMSADLDEAAVLAAPSSETAGRAERITQIVRQRQPMVERINRAHGSLEALTEAPRRLGQQRDHLAGRYRLQGLASALTIEGGRGHGSQEAT
jgi:hypothetical protein